MRLVEEPEQVTWFVCGAILGALVGIALIVVCGWLFQERREGLSARHWTDGWRGI